MTTKHDYKFLNQLPAEKRRKVRLRLIEVLKLRKEQIKNFERVFIAPLKDNATLIERAIKSDFPVDLLMKKQEHLQKYLESLLRTQQ